MSRLTNKDDRGRYYTVEEKILIANEPVNPTTTWITNNENRRYGSPIEKLGKLEDLEDELGCPLEVMVKAISNGIYVKDMPKEDLIKHFGLKLSNIKTEWYLSTNIICVNLKDYKTLFWLKEDKSE